MDFNLMNLVAKLTLDDSDYQDKVGGLSSKLGTAAKVGGAAVAAAGTAVVAFGKSSVDAGMSFDAAMAQVAATSGKSVSEITDLRDFAQEMGSKTSFSATQAAEALNYMALAGYDANTSMDMLPTVLNLAAAGGMDLASASDMVTDAQTALGLSIDDTSRMVDQMAKASSTTNTSVSQLGEALLTVGANARDIKGGTSELSTVFGVLADNGIKGTEAGTHFRNIMLAMNPTTDAATAAWKKLGVQAYDSEGNLRSLDDIFLDLNKSMEGMTDQEKQYILSSMFNKTDLAAVNSLLGTTRDRWNEVRQSVNSGITLDLSVTKQGIMEMQSQFTKLYKNVGGDTEAFSKQAKEYISNAFDISDTQADAAIQTFIDKMGEGVTSTDELYEALAKSGSAAQAMADTQLDNLAGDVTLFKSALEGAQIAVSDQLTPSLRDFVQLGSDGLSKVTTAFKEEGLSGAMKALGDWLSQALNLIIEKIPMVIDAGVQLLSALIQGIIDNIPKLVEASVKILTALIQGLIDNLPKLAKAAVEIITNLAKQISEALPTLIPAAIDAIMTIVEGLIDNIDLLVDAALQLMIGLAEGLIAALPKIIEKIPTIIEKLYKAFTDAIPKIAEAGVKLLTSLVKNLPAIIDAIIKALPEIIKNILSGIAKHWSAIATAGVKLFSALVTNLGEAIKIIVGKIPQVLSAIVDGFKKGFSDMVDVGKQLLEGIGKGIVNAVRSVVQKAKDAARSILDAVKGFFGIASPSKEFAKIGGFLMSGMAKGIDDNLGMVEGAMGDLQDTIDTNTPDMSFNAEGNAGAIRMIDGITMNIYGAEGQDVNALADAVADRFQTLVDMRAAVWA